MRKLSVLTVLCALSLFSCNNGNNTNTSKEAEATTAPAAPAQSKLDETGTKNLMAMVTDYYELKDALVATNAANADAAANKLISSTGNMQGSLDSANATALKPYLDTIVSESKAMTAMMDESCEHKRANFDKISDAMYSLLKKAELKNAGVYHEFCPMAFNERGAYWLSNSAEIKNPYFGKKMLECGEVTDSLK